MENNKIAKIVINIQGKEVSFTEEELRVLQSSINKLLGNGIVWSVYGNSSGGTITTPYITTTTSGSYLISEDAHTTN